MTRPTVVVELGGDARLAGDLMAGGVFVAGCAIALNEDCDLVVRAGAEELVVVGRVVWVDHGGAGLQLLDFDAALKDRIAALAASAAEGEPEPESVSEPEREPEPDPESESDSESESGHPERKIALNVHERLRGLTLAQQIKLAHAGEVSERIVLERMYGKNVWEALLHNPRITGPEVARIARMGMLPRTLIEVIVCNGAWLQIPEVRRALLANPRLGTDQILRVLRLLPKHELKLATVQTAYPMAVRDAAKRMVRDGT